MRKKIGECLVQAGLITEIDLQAALAEQKRSGDRLGTVIVRMNLATERQIAKALAYQLGFSYVHLTDHPPDPAAVVLIRRDVALKRVCIAVSVDKNLLTVAMADPLLFTLVRDLELQTGYRIKQVVATGAEIIDAIHRSYPETAADRVAPTGARLVVAPEDAPADQDRLPKTASAESTSIIDLVDLIIKSALDSGASDIHIEPTEQNVAIRHRLDGLLKPVMDLPKWVHEGVVARIKTLGGMDLAETRRPQDGRVRASDEGGQHVELRASTLRTIFGEKIVLHVLDHRRAVPPFEELGLSPRALEQMKDLLSRQHGMILVAGPTGSGKTTTLCSALTSLRPEDANVVTIEDPVEYRIPGVNHTEVDTTIGLTFASALRAILRQDPDVVVVGDLRDRDAAQIAMQSAQSGQLVLSTLYVDDAAACVARLADIGVEPHITASALIGVVAQRLVRRLCSTCKRPHTPDADTLLAIGVPGTEAPTQMFYRAAGCEQCNHTGYRGRIGIYEVMRIDDTLRRVIARHGSEAAVSDAAVAAGMVPLAADGLAKVTAGLTTPEELLRVLAGRYSATAA